MIPSVFRASKFFVFKSKIEKVPRGIQGEKSSKDITTSGNLVSTKVIEIVDVWVYHRTPFGITYFGTFGALYFKVWKCVVWQRVIYEGSIHEMLISSILLIKSDFKMVYQA